MSNNGYDQVLDMVLSPDVSEEKKEMLLQALTLHPLNIMTVLLSEQVSNKLKVKLISHYSLNKQQLSEDNLKLLHQSGLDIQVLDALAMLLPQCFSGTLVQHLLNQHQLSEFAKEYLLLYIQTHN